MASLAGLQAAWAHAGHRRAHCSHLVNEQVSPPTRSIYYDAIINSLVRINIMDIQRLFIYGNY